MITTPTVTLIAYTIFCKPAHVLWKPSQASDGCALIEFAGRCCYQSWQNPSGRSNEEYIQNIIELGHLSVLEHAQATFYLEGISRSCSHEIVRHRHLSFSQLSQRYVDERDVEFICPPALLEYEDLRQKFELMVDCAQENYLDLVESLEERLPLTLDKIQRRKMMRQTARAVLPNATETKMTVTGNLRAWRHFCRLRCSEHADAEIRAVALEILKPLQHIYLPVFADFQHVEMAGVQCAKTELPHG